MEKWKLIIPLLPLLLKTIPPLRNLETIPPL